MDLRQGLPWSAALIVIIAMIWLTSAPSPDTPPEYETPLSSRPSWQAQGVTQWENITGEIRHLQAAQASHYPRHHTWLEKPTGIIQQTNATYTFKADHGTTTSQSIQLTGHVLIQRLTPVTPPLTLQTPTLHYDQIQHHLSTSKPVRITHGPHWTQGIGLDWWLARQMLKIRKDVISEFKPAHL